MTSSYETINPLYTAVDQVPDWWQDEVQEMIQCGAIRGDGKHPISIRKEALQAAVIAYRVVKGANKDAG